MHLLLPAVERYGFNSRVLSEQDFYDICRQENIEVLEHVPGKHCFYFTLAGSPFIVLGTRVLGTKRRFAMFHELAHHFLHSPHPPQDLFCFGLTESKEETEADALAAIALIPAANVDDLTFLDENTDRYARYVYGLRQQVMFLFGL